MITKTELRKHARGVAENFFYADDNEPWEPFEDQPKSWVRDQCRELEQTIYHSLLWATEQDYKLNSKTDET